MRTIIFANGILSPATAVSEFIQPGDLIIAADGGARHCLALGITPQIVIGDFDSLTPEEVKTLKTADSEIIRHPARKDHNDLELAIAYANARGVQDIIILGGLGGRVDQSAASLLLLASPEWPGRRLRLIDGRQSAEVLHGGMFLQLEGNPGDTVSLLPLSGDAEGITTSGLEYSLTNEKLRYGSTRGVSNTLLEKSAEVHLEHGQLLVVVIGAA